MHPLSGWQQAEELPTNEAGDEEWEEDQVGYIVLDVTGHLSKEALAQQNRVQIAGLSTSTPFLRVGPRVFEGRYEELIGTEVLYVDANNAAEPPTLLGATDQRIRFLPVHLESLDPDNDPSSLDITTVKAVPKAGRGRGKADDNVESGRKAKSKGTGTRGKTKARVIEETPTPSTSGEEEA